MGRRARLCLEAPWVGRDCPPWAHPLAGAPTLVSGSLPHSPSPWLALSPTLSGSLPTEPPTSTRTDSGPSQKSRRDRAREKTLLSSSVGQWPGSEVGTGRGEDGPLVPLRTVGGGASCCLLFPEGRDRIWPGALLAWLGPWGFRLPAGGPPSPQSWSPCWTGLIPVRLRVGASPRVVLPAPLPTSLPWARPAQGRADSPVDNPEKHFCLLGRLLAPSRKQRLASLLVWRPWWRKGRGQDAATPSAAAPQRVHGGARPPHSHLGRLSLCVPDNCSWVGAGSFPSH